MNGNTWAMAEIPKRGGAASATGRARSDPPAVVTQHIDGSRKFVLLNPNVSSRYSDQKSPLPLETSFRSFCLRCNFQESYIVTKLSPVEQLTQLLQQQGPDSDDVRAFFQLHKEQACATCLVLACSQQVVMQPVSTLHSRASRHFSMSSTSGCCCCLSGCRSSHSRLLPAWWRSRTQLCGWCRHRNAWTRCDVTARWFLPFLTAVLHSGARFDLGTIIYALRSIHVS